MSKPKKVESMTSRQRVMATVNHQEPDRVPIDLGMHFSSGISAFAYYDLREYLGLPTDNIIVPDMVQFLARVDDDILERFHVDCKLLFPRFRTEKRWNPRGEYEFIIPGTANPVPNESGDWIVGQNGGRMRMPKNGYFFDGDWMHFEDRPPDEHLDNTAKEAERIYKDSDYYTIYLQFGAFFKEADMDALCRMISDPESIKEENQVSLNQSMEHVSKVIDKMGEYVQGILVVSDLGTQKGPLVNPALYEELCLPYLSKFCDFVHKNSDFKVHMHCCGSIKPFIPLLIEAGIDVLNPVQISAENMDPAELKKEFGDKIVFWGGGCNTQHVLNHGTPDDVRANVRELMSIFKPGGGYVFSQVHNIMGDIPPENIVAMLDTAYEESFY
jgi:uroporphyrinogen decarboxylase